MSLHVEHLLVRHGPTTLVDVADIRVERGRPLTIVGESGSGKSLLAHAVMGTLARNLASGGSMSVDGAPHDLAHGTDRRGAWGRVMALLPQEPVLALDPTMRVVRQVAEGARREPRSGSPGERADALLADLGLAGRGSAFPHTLSGGMAQRVAFAAATIGEAPVLIADEPSKGLDPAARDDLARLLGRHVEAGGMLLTITHDLELARRLGGDVLVMRRAEVVERGEAARVLSVPAHPYTRRLLAAEPGRWTHPWVRRAGAAAGSGGQPLVSAEDLGKAYGAQVLFRDLSLDVGPGERVALKGPSGSGKTTLGNVLLRLQPSDTGRVWHHPALLGGRLQKLYQEPTVGFPARVTIGTGLRDVTRRHGVAHSRLVELMSELGLSPELLDRRPGAVSGGELQRIAIIRAMLLRPALVFADEPTSRLDLITQESTMACLMAQVEREGCALVLVTHDEALAEVTADREVTLTASG